MTEQEILVLKQEAEAAELAAATAEAEAKLDPTNATKAGAAKVAAARAEEAKERWKAGGNVGQQPPPTAAANNNYLRSESTPENKPSTTGVIALGIYLLFMLFFSVYLLGGLMMAETDETEVKRLIAEKKNKQSSNTNTNANVSDSQSNANSNTNSENINITLTPTASPTPTALPTATSTPTRTPTPTPTPPPTNTNGSTIKPTPTPTPTPVQQNFVETSIPPEVYVQIPLLVDSPISADGFLFIIMFCAGMLGAVIRGVYSFFKHIGLRDFSFLWTWFYILVPFIGGALSLVIYFVIRGGFYGSAFGKGLVLNVFSFAALGTLTGLFTDNAMEKLKQIARMLLADVPPKVENSKEITDKKDAASKGNQ